MAAALPLPIVPLRTDFDPAAPRNAMSVDVEDYFQVRAFSAVIDRASWDSIPCRIPANVDRILELFEAARTRATFFVLGWVAERMPSVLRRIVAAGHEVASHGYEHALACDQSPREFREDVGRTRRLLEDVTGVAVLGYRAPTFSIGLSNLWAYDELQEAGYSYSSSLNPIRHDLYGVPGAPRFAFRHQAGGILEIPPTTIRLGGTNLPCSGGGFFRLLPYWAFRSAIRRVNQTDLQPAVFYFHPWEVDPDQPRVADAPLRSSLRHYLNLDKMALRLTRLLRDFRWDRMDAIYGVRPCPAAD